VLLTVVFDLNDVASQAFQIHVWIKVLAVGEMRCYYVTKPDSLLFQCFLDNHIVTTWSQAFLFIPNCGTAVPRRAFLFNTDSAINLQSHY
jgi:hypothetical protein